MNKAQVLTCLAGGVTGGHSQTKSAVRPLLPHADLQQPRIPLLWGPLCGVPISLPTSVLSSGLGTSLGPQQEPGGGNTPHTFLQPGGAWGGLPGALERHRGRQGNTLGTVVRRTLKWQSANEH